MVLLRRRLNVNCEGPSPKLMGTICSPGTGLISKFPMGVDFRFVGEVRLVANAGRSLNTESPFRSEPVVRLKGAPVKNRTNGLTRNPCGMAILPPRKRRLRTSKDARP